MFHLRCAGKSDKQTNRKSTQQPRTNRPSTSGQNEQERIPHREKRRTVKNYYFKNDRTCRRGATLVAQGTASWSREHRSACIKIPGLLRVRATAAGVHSLALHSLTHSLTHSRTRSLTNSRAHELTNSRAHELTSSRTHELTSSLTHSLSHSLHFLTALSHSLARSLTELRLLFVCFAASCSFEVFYRSKSP